MSKYNNYIAKNEILLKRDEIPCDLHWKPEILFLGEIYDTVNQKYYSSKAGKYYKLKQDEKHLDEGHFTGYRFAIQTLTLPGDWVFDPTVGSGTAIIESINNKRNAVGIELEYPSLCVNNVRNQNISDQIWVVIHGNAKNILPALRDAIPDQKFNLIINGTPYPIINGGKTSDAPFSTDNNDRNYQHPDSFGRLRFIDPLYKSFIQKMYFDCIDVLKEGGYLCIIIKDPIQNKKPFLLQKHIIDWIKEDNRVTDYGYFIHRHIPETLFMRTYNKRFPDVLIPFYQIGYVLKKISS